MFYNLKLCIWLLSLDILFNSSILTFVNAADISISQTQIELLTPKSKVFVYCDFSRNGKRNQIVYFPIEINKQITYYHPNDDMIDGDAIADDNIYTQKLLAYDLRRTGFFVFDVKVDIIQSFINLTQTYSSNALRIVNIDPSIPLDPSPPATPKITKFFIKTAFSRIVSVSFLAVGDNGFDGGPATMYYFRIEFPWPCVIEMFDVVQPNTIVTKELQLYKCRSSKPFKFKMRARDKVGRYSEWSVQLSYTFDDTKVYPDDYNSTTKKPTTTTKKPTTTTKKPTTTTKKPITTTNKPITTTKKPTNITTNSNITISTLVLNSTIYYKSVSQFSNNISSSIYQLLDFIIIILLVVIVFGVAT